MDKIEYPAVLVLARWDHNLQRPITMLDGVVVHNDVELEERQNAYRMLEYLGGVPYIYTLAAVGTEHEIMKQRAEELWTQQTFGRRYDDDAWADHRDEQAEYRAVMAGVL